jgi:hypothetical protein
LDDLLISLDSILASNTRDFSKRIIELNPSFQPSVVSEEAIKSDLGNAIARPKVTIPTFPANIINRGDLSAPPNSIAVM